MYGYNLNIDQVRSAVAAQNDDRESVEALLEAGADPSLASDDGQTPADLAGDATRDLVAVSN